MLTQVTIPEDLGDGGAFLAKNGGAGTPSLADILADLQNAHNIMNQDPVALTDATLTIQLAAGRNRVLPAATLTAGRSLTLGTTGAVKGDQIEVLRLDVTANTYAVINGGVGTGTLITFPVSKLGYARFRFDGTNWALRAFGEQP